MTVNNTLRENELINRIMGFSEVIDDRGFGDFIGASPPMKLVYQIIRNVAPTEASFL